MLPTLETERLLLRPFVQGDLMDFYEYAKSPLVGPAAGWPPHKSLEDSRKILDGFLKSDEVFALELKETGRVIGSLGLHPDEKRTPKDVRALGYVLSDAYWGEGLMPEAARAALAYAFEVLGVALVSVYHFPHNDRSRRVIEKLGFRREGVLRYATVLPGGAVCDDVSYSMTREEYGKISKGSAD